MVDPVHLLGTWKLCSLEVRKDNGETSYPFGKRASGYLIYAPDGYMSVAIMAEDRRTFHSPDIRAASTDEQAHAASTYLSYCGRYELIGDRVVHHVAVSLFPNWIGQTQERQVELERGRLCLSTPRMQLEGFQQTACLIWERCEA